MSVSGTNHALQLRHLRLLNVIAAGVARCKYAVLFMTQQLDPYSQSYVHVCGVYQHSHLPQGLAPGLLLKTFCCLPGQTIVPLLSCNNLCRHQDVYTYVLVMHVTPLSSI